MSGPVDVLAVLADYSAQHGDPEDFEQVRAAVAELIACVEARAKVGAIGPRERGALARVKGVAAANAQSDGATEARPFRKWSPVVVLNGREYRVRYWSNGDVDDVFVCNVRTRTRGQPKGSWDLDGKRRIPRRGPTAKAVLAALARVQGVSE